MNQFRAVQWTTDAAAAVCGQEARDGYIRAKQQEREKWLFSPPRVTCWPPSKKQQERDELSVFTKSLILATFCEAYICNMYTMAKIVQI